MNDENEDEKKSISTKSSPTNEVVRSENKQRIWTMKFPISVAVSSYCRQLFW